MIGGFDFFHKCFLTHLRLTMTQPPRHSPVLPPPQEPAAELAKQEHEQPATNDAEPPMMGLSMPLSPSIEYLDDDDESDEEDDDDKFNSDLVAAPSMPMRPPPTSISTIRLCQENRSRLVDSNNFIE